MWVDIIILKVRCMTHTLIIGHFRGSVRNVASRGMAVSISDHCPFPWLRDLPRLLQNSHLVSVSSQAGFPPHGIIAATLQTLGEANTPICFRLPPMPTLF